ncbi:MAG: mercuric transport protein MerTP [Flavobacteriaceae bacterium]|jgi:copper chaperone CopZ|nr:mercuric transport protein MerTP [Flavobacteriaceae bacterium]
MKKEGKLISTGILAAIAASFCCITPLLALITGATGLASSFSWLEPFRPYLIGLSIVVLAFAWFQKLKQSRRTTCDCTFEQTPKQHFFQSKLFLSLITIFTVAILSFPYYLSFRDTNIPKQEQILTDGSSKIISFEIDGMTCQACESHINQKINELKGIIQATTSYNDKKTVVQYDNTQLTQKQIEQAILATGYTIINTKEN